MRVTLRLALALATLVVPACGGGGGGGGGDPEPARFRILESTPADGQTYVGQDVTITVRLSEAVDPATLPGSVVLASGLGVVAMEATLAEGNRAIVVDPDARLDVGTTITLTLRVTLLSVKGEDLGRDRGISFRTVPQATPRPPRAEDFHPTGPLVTGRSQHTATLLEDGMVLLAGGFTTSSAVTAKAELFDPETLQFAPVSADLTAARARHTATLLQDGRVLLVGGLANGGNRALASCEIYDPALGTFGATGPLAQARAYHTADLLENGRVLVCGGAYYDDQGDFLSLDSAEIYNPATGTWATVSERMVRERVFHTSTTLEDGRILLAGGASDRAAEIFDPVSRTFTRTKGNTKEYRGGHTAVLLENGDVLLSGGGAMRGETYVPKTDSFEHTDNSLSWDRTFATATPIPDGGVLVLGGIFFGEDDVILLASMDLFARALSPNGSYYQVAYTLFDARAGHTATPLGDGSILYAGGINPDSTQPELKTAFVFRQEE
jgi:hypothetical protein